MGRTRGQQANRALSADQLADVFNRRYGPMVRLAAWLTGDARTAEDVVQDAFVQLASVDLAGVAVVDAYLRTIVVNLCRNGRRRSLLDRRHRFTGLGADQPLESPGPESLLADEDLARAVSRLPRRQRQCVVLRFTEDLAVAEIATVLGIGEGSVKTHLHRALATLEATLDSPGLDAAPPTTAGDHR